ncbi:hypothetical protein EF405_20235 [Cyclobacteriaceae bacterium YHN15]|nr:hypothetical protein EF405_20235 [Cyclobacteriaceae bacterium YHN15]
MEKNRTGALIDEQQICISCGFCCDNTLFDNAVLQPGEKGTLPEKMEESYIKIKNQEYFKLPCFYFNGKCSIYNQKKAHICSSFRCQLLKNFEAGKITQKDAIELVRQTKQTRVELLKEYQQISGKSEVLTFREILVALGKKQKELEKKASLSMEWEIFAAKCNIFESLLIKHFKSEEDFDKMMSTSEKGK